MEFTAEQLKIFEYLLPTGERRFIDPMDVRRVLLDKSKGKIDELARKSTEPMLLQAAIANSEIAMCVREAFGLQPVDPLTGTGAPEAYCVELFNQYSRFLTQKKTNCETTPTPSASSDGPQATA